MTSTVLARLTSCHTYQDVQLLRCDEAITYLKEHKSEYTDSVIASLRYRLKDQYTPLLCDVLLLLATQGWDRLVYAKLSEAAVGRLALQFLQPLQSAGANTSLFREEWASMSSCI